MTSNFEFLRQHDSFLHKWLVNAEQQYSLGQSLLCVSLLRSVCEKIVVNIYNNVNENDNEARKHFHDQIDFLTSENHIPSYISNKLHYVRRKGNQAIHYLIDNLETANHCLQNTFQIAIWYCQKYYNYQRINNLSYNPPAVKTFEEIKLEKDSLIQDYHHQVEDLEEEIAQATEKNPTNNDPQQELQEKINTLEQHLEKARAKEKQAKIDKDEIEKITEKDQKIEELKELIDYYHQKISKDISSIVPADSIKSEDLNYTNFQSIINKIKQGFQKIAILIGEKSEETITINNDKIIIPGLGFNNEAEQLKSQIKDLENGLFKLIVLGEFNHGKSTLINALLGQELLPSNLTPTTAFINKLIYGEQESIKLVKEDKSWETLSKEEFKENYTLLLDEREEQTEKYQIFQDIKYAVVSTPSSLLKNSIMLIDSPGLNENEIRSKLSISFFQLSQAIIIILNPNAILSKKEKEFIEDNCHPGYMDHVFFIVNKFDKVRHREKDKVRNHFKKYLSQFFVDDQGEFNETFYNQRVFFVSSKKALDARITGDTDKETLKESGIDEFEKQLENFLISSYRITAIVSSKLKFLMTLVEQVRLTAQTYRNSSQQSLEQLEEKRRESEKQLEDLSSRQSDISEIINTYSDLIIESICSDLEKYIYDMERRWPEAGKSYIDDEQLNPLKLSQSLVHEGSKDEIINALKSSLQKYLEYELKKWGRRVPRVVEEYSVRLSERLDTEIDDFVRQLAEIQNIFAQGDKQNLAAITSNRSDKVMEVMASLVRSDFSSLIGSTLKQGAWTEFIGFTIQQSIIATIILTVIGGPMEWVVVGMAAIVGLITQGNQLYQKVLEQIGKKFHQKLREQLPELKEIIRSELQQKFDEFSEQINQALQTQIEEVNQEQQKIIQDKEKSNEELELEAQRIEMIREEIVNQINCITEKVYDKRYSLEEIECMARFTNLQEERN